MALTIDDIYDKEFALKGGGYDRNDVDQFLDEICDEMTNMQERIDQLESELSKARAEAEAARESVKPAPQPVAKAEPAVAKTSQTLESILLSAQRLADEAVENANAKAETIVKEAQEKASQIVDDAQSERETLSAELESMRKAAAEYKDSFLAMVNKYKTMLEGEDFLEEVSTCMPKEWAPPVIRAALTHAAAQHPHIDGDLLQHDLLQHLCRHGEGHRRHAQKIMRICRREGSDGAHGRFEITPRCARRWASTEALS